MRHLLEIPELPPEAFKPICGRMRLYGGKSDAPEAPDYMGQALATAQGNLQAARAQASANRMNQVTPYGSIEYTQGNGYDYSAFEQAKQDYAAQQADIFKPGGDIGGSIGAYKAAGTLLSKPKLEDFLINPDRWSSKITLDPAQQKLLDAQNKTALGMAGLQDQAMQRLAKVSGQPFDTSGIPGMRYNVDSSTGMDAWDKASALIMERMNPELDSQQAALDTKLANMGLTAGSEGWQTQQMQFGKQRNDANVAAQLAGSQLQNQMFNQALQSANLNNQGIAQEFQNRAFLRSIPLNELNALRSGSQVQNPTFTSPGLQGQTSGPDLSGASQGMYNAALGKVNAENAQAASNTQAGVGVASAIISAIAMY